MSTSINVNFDSYIPEEKDVRKSKLRKGSLTIALLFVLSGCPNSFNFADAVWCELAWFESSQPEGETLASWFLILQVIVTLAVVCMLYVEIHLIIFPKIGLMWCFSFGTVLLCGVLSFTWHFSKNGCSLFLYLAFLFGMLTGWVQTIFVIPWLANNYNPRIISVFLSGNRFMTIILVSLELIQEPGGAKIFSPSVYFMVAGIIYVITSGVCIYTFNSGIERLTSKDAVQTLEPWRNSLWTQTFTPVFWDTKMLTFGTIWIIHFTWGVIEVALPYAADNTTSSDANDGENFLQWAVAIGYLTEFLGGVASYIPTENFWIRESIALNTIANGVIILAAANVGVWSSWVMRFLLMTSFVVARFSFGWAMPLIPRELSRTFPDKKELVVRSNSLWSLYANVVMGVPLWIYSSGIISSSTK